MRAVTVVAVLAAAAVVGLAAPRAHAQIVDVQTLIGHDVPEGVSGKLEASLDWRTGNTRLFHTAGAVVGRWRDHDHLVFAVARGEYDESAGVAGTPLVTDVAKDFEHVRYRYHLEPWLATEVFVQHEADRFRRLRLRALAGAGLRVRVAHGDIWSVHVGGAYLAEYEVLVDDALPDAGLRAADSRLSTYAVALVKLNEEVSASETVYAQPRFTDPRDVRLLEEAALTSKLASRVAFRCSFVVAYDSRPVPDTATTDTSVQSAIQVTF